MSEEEMGVGPGVDEAVHAFRSGRSSVVLVVESADGSASSLLDVLEGLTPTARAVAGEATRGRVGCLMQELAVEELGGQVVVVEDAQWADPTSLGRLQRRIRTAVSPFLLMVAHRPLSPSDDWGIGRLVDTARRHSILREIRLDTPPERAPETPPDPSRRDLVLAAGLMSESLPVAVVAALLGIDEAAALDVAESLVASGHLQETRRGFHAVVPADAMDVGEARLGHVAGRLAAVLAELDGDPATVGSLMLVADDPEGAYPRLVDAAQRAARRGAGGEAHHLAVAALQAADRAGVASGTERGELHLVAGRYLRAAGRSESAAHHLREAAAGLEGTARIDALGYAAAVADDRQRPQEAERLLAVAEWEAVRHGERAKLGSLATFHARALHRIGFAGEADALLEKAEGLLAEGANPVQRLHVENNRAWIDFDRGQVRLAETRFTHARDMTDPEDAAALADKEAWRARALFASGRPDEALSAVEVARQQATQADVEAPLFLAELALVEGNLAFGRHLAALEAADRVLDLVERQLPAWENVAHAQRAQVLSRLGRWEEAGDEVEAALRATPAGADGWRWRCRIQAVGLEVDAGRGRRWDRREAEDLADRFLQARYFGWAAELMCLMAERERDEEVAEEAMALSLQIGNPLLAARAAQAGRLWRRPTASATVRAIQAMEGRVPSEWMEAWREVPGVDGALAATVPADDESAVENVAVLDRALRRAGLSTDETILSPAQRRSRGLVTRRRRRRSLRVMAAALGVVGVAALTSIGVAQLDEAPAVVTIVREIAADPQSPEPEVPSLEETQIEVPAEANFLFGQAPLRGGPARTGIFDVTGARRVEGYYWRYETAGPILATPVAYGRNLLVPSADGSLYALDQTSGEVAWTVETGGRLTASPAVAMVEAQEGRNPALAVIAGDDGVVRARDAVTELQSEAWSVTLDSRVASSPVIAEGKVFVGTVGGAVHAFDLAVGEEVWRHPTEGEGLGPISAPLAYHDGVVYVGTEEGTVHLLEAGSGEERCSDDLGADIVASPMVADGAVYLPTRGNTIFVRPVGACAGSVEGRLPLYGTETPVEVSPAIRGDVMYLPSGQFLYAIDLRDNSHRWAPSTVDAGDVISGAPVVADGAVYFGTRSGLVRAVADDSGETLWEWRSDNFVRASPVVVDGAVFVAGGDGTVHALGAR